MIKGGCHLVQKVQGSGIMEVVSWKQSLGRTSLNLANVSVKQDAIVAFAKKK